MNKKLRKLLNQINGIKAEITQLVDAGDLDGAEAKKAELVDLQRQFDLLKDIEDEELENAAEQRGITPADGQENTAEHRFANALRMGFRNDMNEGTGLDGGYTVPEDIDTRIREYREATYSLRNEVEVVPVTTMSGQRTYKKRAQHTGFNKVGEGAAIGKKATPQFERLQWAVEKYAGYFPVTNELLEDSDANITQVLTSWIGDESNATDNALILAELTAGNQAAITDLDDIKKILNVTLGQAFRPTSKIYTNDDGLQWLDTLKDGDEKYILHPDLHAPMQYTVAAGATSVPLRVLPNSVWGSATSGSTTTIPFIIGDLKEGIALFDRKKTTLKLTDTAAAGDLNAFEEDLTLIRAILREDVEVKDAQAFVYAGLAVTA